jgi:imidazolonepropionase-like amidohydrolase
VVVSLREGDAGSGAPVVDFGDATIMPGLIDCHTHVAAFVVPSTYLTSMFAKYRVADNVPEATIYSVRNAQAMLKNGFTTIRDVGGGAGIDLAIRDAVNDGAIVGPRIFAAGQALSITGGHGDSNDVPGWVDEDPSVRMGAISYGPYGFRELVRQHVKLHADHIKILATGGVPSYGDVWDVPQFNLDEVRAVVEESTKYAAGLRDEGMHRAIASSVKIAYGTDAGVFPHDQNNKDFALLVRLGMRPIDVLRSATFDAAELIGVTDRGRLAPGTFADVVVFNGDPTTRIGVMERPPALVMLGGRKIDAARLPG